MHFSSFLLFWQHKMRFNILVKPIFPNYRFSAIRNLDFTFSHTLAVQKWTRVILIFY